MGQTKEEMRVYNDALARAKAGLPPLTRAHRVVAEQEKQRQRERAAMERAMRKSKPAGENLK